MLQLEEIYATLHGLTKLLTFSADQLWLDPSQDPSSSMTTEMDEDQERRQHEQALNADQIEPELAGSLMDGPTVAALMSG